MKIKIQIWRKEVALKSVWNISLSSSLDCVCLSPFPQTSVPLFAPPSPFLWSSVLSLLAP